MDEFTEEQIIDILNQYKLHKQRMQERYERIKDTDEFRKQNRARAKAHYQQNKEKKRQKYLQNKDIINARNIYYYYKNSVQNIDLFIERHPEKYNLLKSNGYFNDQKPSSSTDTPHKSSSVAEPSSSL
jgi:hypothetical protein